MTNQNQNQQQQKDENRAKQNVVLNASCTVELPGESFI